MSPKDTPPEGKPQKPVSGPEEPEDHKHRRHGYRGYPNNPEIGGDIHTGTGFAGVGPGGAARESRESSIFTEKTRESVEELGEEEEAEEEKKK